MFLELSVKESSWMSGSKGMQPRKLMAGKHARDVKHRKADSVAC